MSASGSLVLFDIDGTLVRGAGAHHRNALIEGIRKVTGIETHLNGVSTSGMLDRDLIVHMLSATGYAQRRTRASLGRIMQACQIAYAADCATDLTGAVCLGVR